MLSIKLMQLYFKLYSQIAPNRSAEQARKLMLTPKPVFMDKTEVNPDEKIALNKQTCISVWRRGKPQVLLMHGWSGGAYQFNPILNLLLANDFTVIVAHPAGHADTDCHMANLESHPGKFIQAIEDVITLYRSDIDYAIGHSMGAAALAIYSSHQSVFKRLVLVSSPASFSSVLERFSKAICLSERGKKVFFNKVEDYVGIPHKELIVSEVADGNSTPCLIIHDEKDKEVPHDEAILLSSAFKSSIHLSTTGLGHKRILNDHFVVDSIVQFLSIANQETTY